MHSSLMDSLEKKSTVLLDNLLKEPKPSCRSMQLLISPKHQPRRTHIYCQPEHSSLSIKLSYKFTIKIHKFIKWHNPALSSFVSLHYYQGTPNAIPVFHILTELEVIDDRRILDTSNTNSSLTFYEQIKQLYYPKPLNPTKLAGITKWVNWKNSYPRYNSQFGSVFIFTLKH